MQIIEETLGIEGYQKLLLLLKEIADAHHVSTSNVATRFILEQKDVGAAIVGIRNSRHVKDNTQIFSFDLSEEEKTALRSLLDRYPTLDGDCYQLERYSDKFRGIIHMNVNKEEN